ncbi:MAG: 50S ribosomal protein L29 [Candidatus Wildermuthbacteria bacterium]|nr:50S ribosomal protein L29 [Candidatus Wildermuthbacteria bacterium]
MKPAELKMKSKEELANLALELRGKLRQLRFEAAAGKLKDVREIRETRKTIAQILTIMRQGLK